MDYTHQGHVVVTALGSGTEEDDYRPDTPAGAGYEDVTRTPVALYKDPAPNTLVVKLYADEATFLALGDDVLWYEEIPQMPQ